MFKIGLTTKLYLCYTFSSCPVVFCLPPSNSNNASEKRGPIESIYSKNNNYLLIDRAYTNDKTLALAKAHRFFIVISLKKITNFPNYIMNDFINREIILNDISLG